MDLSDFFLVDSQGPKILQRLMSEGQMRNIAQCVSIHFQVDKGPNKNGRQAGFGPRLLSPFFYLLCSEVIKYCYFEAIALVHLYLDEFTQIAHWEVL